VGRVTDSGHISRSFWIAAGWNDQLGIAGVDLAHRLALIRGNTHRLDVTRGGQVHAHGGRYGGAQREDLRVVVLHQRHGIRLGNMTDTRYVFVAHTLDPQRLLADKFSGVTRRLHRDGLTLHVSY
jgi:hypothetical protein